jgi:hypothetical protein
MPPSRDEKEKESNMLTSSLALDMPFLLLPFRPSSDPSSARNFIRNFFRSSYEGSNQYTGAGLSQELRLAEPLVGPPGPLEAPRRRC